MTQQEYEDACRRLIDAGRLLEVGFLSFCRLMIPPQCSALLVENMRKAFFSGAMHLFGSIRPMLEASEETTEADFCRRMNMIQAELNASVELLRMRGNWKK